MKFQDIFYLEENKNVLEGPKDSFEKDALQTISQERRPLRVTSHCITTQMEGGSGRRGG